MDAVLATSQEIAQFTIVLDSYDTKTVEASMDNQDALTAVREKIDVLMDQAEVLPDGHRVFKTKDGQRVFDEHGQEMSRETIDPNSINDRKPKWEAFRAEREAEKRLTEERQQLIDYQAKLDHARERLNKGEITEGELKDMKAALKAEMPETVRDKLEHEKTGPAAEPPKDAPAPVRPNDMEALMQKIGFAPGPATR